MPTYFALAAPFTAAAEVLRRAMWAVLRVESEHLHTEGYRRVQSVPLAFDGDVATASGRRRGGKASRESDEAAQRRSRALVIVEIVSFFIVVMALAATAVLTRARELPPTRLLVQALPPRDL
jgi:hypothetical protein